MSEVTVEHNPTQSRYDAHVEGQVVGFVQYRTSGNTIDLFHTEVEPAHEGEGVGTELVRGTLDLLRADHLTVVPSCPFVRSFIDEHEDYEDLVDPR